MAKKIRWIKTVIKNMYKTFGISKLFYSNFFLYIFFLTNN